jgi:predicted nucleic acid-binding protein
MSRDVARKVRFRDPAAGCIWLTRHETTQAANANCIVSGDHHLLQLASAADMPVITDRGFLGRLGRGSF